MTQSYGIILIMAIISRKRFYQVLGIVCLILLLFLSSGKILEAIGRLLVIDDKPVRSDCIVVLNTGVEYYPRLIEAANLFKQGFAKKIAINGDRKTDTLRELERKGFKSSCAWYEDRVSVLEMLGVPRRDILIISAEDAYDSISEARAVGEELMGYEISNIILTTSKYHSRRADHIWKRIYGNSVKILTVSAKSDPYDPKGWWKDGRQIRWVLAEYGAWFYYFWKIRTLNTN